MVTESAVRALPADRALISGRKVQSASARSSAVSSAAARCSRRRRTHSVAVSYLGKCEWEFLAIFMESKELGF